MNITFNKAIMGVMLIALTQQAIGQNTFPASGAAGIGTTTPDASSLLDINSTNKGFLTATNDASPTQRHRVSGERLIDLPNQRGKRFLLLQWNHLEGCFQ
jgi:hypothetical protein